MLRSRCASTLATPTFTSEDGSTAFGDFYARYCVVENDRPIWAHIRETAGTYPHLIVGSQQTDLAANAWQVISIAQRPSSSINSNDPFFLTQPDMGAINGLASQWGQIVTSSENGSIYKLTGADATDFAMVPLFPRSGAFGKEAMTATANDVLYGRRGSIESVRDTEASGNVEANDISRPIKDDIETYGPWRLYYNPRLERTYCFPDSQSKMYVLFNNMVRTPVSPWVPWCTDHALDFQPTEAMVCLDPVDGLEYLYMGDASGNLYKMEGTAGGGDGGNTDVPVSRTSKVFHLEPELDITGITGWITYRQGQANTCILTFEWSGDQVSNESVSIPLKDAINNANQFYGGTGYYGDQATYYGGQLPQRLTRQVFSVPGKSSRLAIRTEVSGSQDFNIHEIHLEHEVVET